MAKNLIPQVCKLLGVEVGEKFKIKDAHTDYTTFTNYLINEDGRVIICNDNGDDVCAISLDNFLAGDYEIVKLPWKPRYNDDFYSFAKNSVSSKVSRNTVMVIKDIWFDTINDFARLKAGWVYHTKREAEAALPKVIEEMGVEYEL